jgi:hypothetical protein
MVPDLVYAPPRIPDSRLDSIGKLHVCSIVDIENVFRKTVKANDLIREESRKGPPREAPLQNVSYSPGG